MSIVQKMIYKLKNKKGMSTIEIIIGVLIFLALLCFMLDLLILTWKFSVVAQTNTYLARVSGIQGGALWSAPDDYPGGYETIGELNATINEKFQAAGIASTEWSGSVGNGRIGSHGTSESSEYDYKEVFTTEITVRYRWEFMSNIIPGSLTQTITSRRPAMSEWKYNYADWDGE